MIAGHLESSDGAGQVPLRVVREDHEDGGARAFAAGVRSDREVLLVCAGVIVAATVLNLCVRDVYRINRATSKPS